MAEIVSTLPPGLEFYRSTPLFVAETVPAGLLAAHSTKAGVWGLLKVQQGRVRYCLDEGERESSVIIAGGVAVIEPERPHHVELLDADSAFCVEFYRASQG